MAAQWADFPSGSVGIYNYDTSKMLDGIWAENTLCTLVDDPDPNILSAGRCLRVGINSIGSGAARKVLTGNRTTVGMSARMYLPSLSNRSDMYPIPFSFRDGSNTLLTEIRVTTTGALQVIGPLGTVIGATSGPIVTAAAWTHLSVKVVFGSGSTGSVTIEREGFPVLTLTSVATGAGPCAQVTHANQAAPTSAVCTMYIKDSYIWDGNGSVNNDHPGPVTVYRQTVSSDVSSGWSKTTGTSDYAILDDSPPDDAEFIYAGYSPLPAPSIMGLEDLPPDVISIRALFLVGRQRKSDGGDCTTQMSITPNGGTDWFNGTDRAITTAFTYWFDVSELSPDTGLPWTPVEFNASTFKIDRTL